MAEHSEEYPWFKEANLDPITGLEPPPDQPSVSWDTAFSAGFSRQSPLTAGFERVLEGKPFAEEVFPPQEGFDPLADPATEGYEAINFAGSQSPEENQQRIQKIQRSRGIDAETQGFAGFLGETVGFVTNPLLAGGIALTGGMSAVPEILTLGAIETANEVIAHSQKPTRTKMESYLGVGGVMGLTAVGKLVFGRSRAKISEDLAGEPTPPQTVSGDAGAALARQPLNLTEPVRVVRPNLVRALGGTRTSPVSDVVTNAVTNEAKQLIREMMEVSIRVEGKATTPAESMIRESDGKVYTMTRDFEGSYRDYRKSGGTKTDVEFLELVSDIMRNGDDFASIPTAQSLARSMRKIKDDIYTRADKVGLVDKLMKDFQGSRFHFPRMYKKAALLADRAGFKEVVLRNLGKDERFLIRLKPAAEGEQEIISAVLPSEWPKLQTEYGARVELAVGTSLDDAAESIISTITGNGNMMDFVGLEHAIPKAGSLQERTLGFIPDAELRPYLENNALAVMSVYTKQMTRDIVMKTKFSGSDMAEEFATVRAAAAKKMSEAKPKDVKKMDDRLKKDMTILEAQRDKLLGTFGRPTDPSSVIVQFGRWTKIGAMLSSGLNIPTSSIPDIVAPSLRHGFKPFYAGIRVLASGQGPAYRKYTAMIGIATESVTNNRALAFADAAFASPLQKKALRGFGKYTGLSLQTDIAKTLNAISTSEMFIGWIKKGTSKSNKLKMLDMGIDDKWAKRIKGQLAEHSDKSKSVELPETHLWDDKAAANVFESALRKEVDTTTLTPSLGDLPLWAGTEGGRFLFLFQSFVTSAHSKFLIAGLQRADADFATGVLLMTTAGFLTTAIKDKVRGEDITDKKLDQMMFDSVDRAGVLGWMAPPVNLARQFLTDQVPSRYQARRKITGVIGTATTSYLTDIAQSSYGVLAEGNESDMWRLARKVPFANSFHFVDLMQTMSDNR